MDLVVAGSCPVFRPNLSLGRLTEAFLFVRGRGGLARASAGDLQAKCNRVLSLLVCGSRLKSFMSGGSVEGDGAGDGVDVGLEAGEFRGGEAGEVGGAFGAPGADEAVGVFNGAFLPGGVGVGVVDGSVEDGIEFGLVEELATVVGGDGEDGV